MSHHLHSDLERVEKQLLYLAAQVEEAVRKSVAALLERKQDLALDVIQGDEEIDRQEVELEEECLKILALHQPVANDLRFTTACLKIDNDLERIGDLAVNIAKRAAFLTTVPVAHVPVGMREMMEAAMQMVRESLDAFVAGDADAARAVCVADNVIDRFHRKITEEITQVTQKGEQSVEIGLMLFSVSKALERIADHATNIAEDVVYMVEGEIIRHGLGESDAGGTDSKRSAS